MCLMLYIGTPTELAPLTTPDLTVEAVESRRAIVQQTFAHTHVRFVGAHTGCSCGFPSFLADVAIAYYDGMPLQSDHREADLRSVRALLELLRDVVPDDGFVELYPVADGDETKQPKGWIDWNLPGLVPERLFFNEGFMHRVHNHPEPARVQTPPAEEATPAALDGRPL